MTRTCARCQLDLDHSCSHQFVLAPAARAGPALAEHLKGRVSVTDSHRQQRASRRLGRRLGELAQVVPAPSEQDVRIEAMIQRDAGNRGARD